MKQCIRCLETKSLAFFPSWKKGSNVCKPCHNSRRTAQRRKLGIRQKEHVREYMRTYRKNNRETLLKKKVEKRKASPLQALWRQLKAKPKRGHSVTVTKAEFLSLSVPEMCPVLGIPLSYDLGRDNLPSVDRMDPNGPYSLENIAIVSYRANMIKSIGGADEHDAVARWMRNNGVTTGKAIGGLPIKIGPSTVTFGRNREPIGDGVRAISASAEEACCR